MQRKRPIQFTRCISSANQLDCSQLRNPAIDLSVSQAPVRRGLACSSAFRGYASASPSFARWLRSSRRKSSSRASRETSSLYIRPGDFSRRGTGVSATHRGKRIQTSPGSNEIVDSFFPMNRSRSLGQIRRRRGISLIDSRYRLGFYREYGDFQGGRSPPISQAARGRLIDTADLCIAGRV